MRRCIGYILRSTVGAMLSEQAQIAVCKQLGAILADCINSFGMLQRYCFLICTSIYCFDWPEPIEDIVCRTVPTICLYKHNRSANIAVIKHFQKSLQRPSKRCKCLSVCYAAVSLGSCLFRI